MEAPADDLVLKIIKVQSEYAAKGTLTIWTVYDHPTDLPDHYVARCWAMDQPTQYGIASDTLEALRRVLDSAGLVCLTRSENDDPVIVETWL